MSCMENKHIPSSESEKLQAISEVSTYSAGVMPTAITYSYQLLQRHMRGETVLEMGPAEGVMTERLVASGKLVTVVEGSALFCDSLRQRFPHIEVVHSLFEDYTPARRFDTVVLGHVLEHVQDPVDVLRRVKAWLAPSGCVFAAVPNSRSIHRQAAVLMGLLPQVHRKDTDIADIISRLLQKAHGIHYNLPNIPNKYLRS